MQNDVDKLIRDNKKLIDLEASRYATNLPLITVQIEAYKLAREAARTYDPKSGYKFSTHLVNNLKKLSRLSTKYGNIVRIPENTQFDINRLNKLEKNLEHTLGREPTVEELSFHSGMSTKNVLNTKQSRKAVTGISSLFNTPELFDSNNDEWVHFVYHDLSDKDKLIFEHKTGFGGKSIMDNKQLAKKLNLSQSTLNNRIRLMNNTLAKGWR
jgi:DNA-directed RNA polymerase sigma subunit (sigma70/sigma32)